MRAADGWQDYELIDTSGGERLERWGDVLLIRPDPQVIWQTPRTHPLWIKPMPGITGPPPVEAAGNGAPPHARRMADRLWGAALPSEAHGL